jgi:hypothetical protein
VSIPGDPGDNNFADFPTLGLDAQGVYLSGDLLDANGTPVGPTLVSIPKADLLATPPSASRWTWFGVMTYTNRGDVLQPAICLDGSGTGNILAAGGVGLGIQGNIVTNNTLVHFTVQKPSGAEATLSASTFITVSPYTVPLKPTQPDGSSRLDAGDARISASVYEVGGVLYAVHSTQVGNLDALQWFRIDAASHSVLESGFITDPVKDLFYGSIAANAQGTVVIAYNGTSTNTPVSSFALVGSTVNGVTTFGTPLLLKQGTGSYRYIDPSGLSRWGDYSTTTVDPADPTRFWTIQEVPVSTSAWATQVTELITGSPALNITLTANGVVLSWSSSSLGLQTTTSLDVPNRTAVTESITTNNGVLSVTVPLTNPGGFTA